MNAKLFFFALLVLALAVSAKHVKSQATEVAGSDPTDTRNPRDCSNAEDCIGSNASTVDTLASEIVQIASPKIDLKSADAVAPANYIAPSVAILALVAALF